MRPALAALLIIFSAPAFAGEPPKAAAGQYVDLAPVALPIVDGGKLRNYVFVSIRLNLAPGADPTKLREKQPYFRDALVRSAYRQPFTVAADWARVDEVRLKAVMMREAAAIAGPGQIISVGFVSPPMAQRHLGMARPQG